MLLDVLVVYSIQWRIGRGVSLPEAPQTHLSTIKIMYVCFPGISVISGYSDLGFGGL